MTRLAWMLLMIGLVANASAARAPKDPSDLMNRLDPLWGKSAADFPKAAGLKAGEYQNAASVNGVDRTAIAITEAGRARWTPKPLANAAQSAGFDAKLGLIEVTGSLPGTTADFEALIKALNARYGQYSLHNTAGDTHTYGWIFPKATLSVELHDGSPAAVRIQANL